MSAPPVQFSLTKTKKKSKRTRAAAFGLEPQDKEKSQQQAEHDGQRKSPLVIPTTGNQWKGLSAEDKAAAEALTSNKSSSKNDNNNNPQKLVVSVAANTNASKPISRDDDQYKQDLEQLPEDVPIDSDVYQKVPIAEFGAALLRGMGWKEEPKQEDKAQQQLPRPHRLGLGATPKLPDDLNETSKRRSKRPDQFHRQKALEKQQAQFAQEKQARIQADRQRTLQNESLVWLTMSSQRVRARIVQLVGVPGLNRVKVQVENEPETSIVKRGAIEELVTRHELEDRPFVQESIGSKQNSKSRSHPRDDGNKKEERQSSSSRDDGNNKKRHRTGDLSGSKETSHRTIKNQTKKSSTTWLCTNIRVRIITEKLGRKYFKEKAVVVDVTPKGATLQLNKGGTVLDRVPERYLETALPKTTGSTVAQVIVLAPQDSPKYHAKGRLLERNSRTGVVQFAEDMDVLTLSLDDIAEWCGPLDD